MRALHVTAPIGLVLALAVLAPASASAQPVRHRVPTPASAAATAPTRDTDGDGLSDRYERRVSRTSARNHDTDGDGLSDRYEWRRSKTDPRRRDTDRDGLTDRQELFRWDVGARLAGARGVAIRAFASGSSWKLTSPRLSDTDRDGLSDGAETLTYGTDPTRADTDGDGLKDGTEVLQLHTNPLLADTDGDGISDGAEVRAGSDPLDPASPGTAPVPTRDTTAPDTTMSAAPPATTTSAVAAFSFAGTDNVGVTAFDCALDGAAWTPCTSPASYANLAAGSHTFAVRARDAAGNVDASPATAAWTVFPADGTLAGSRTVQAAADYAPSGLAEAFSMTARDSGLVASGGVYLDAANAATTVKVGVYSDRIGHPGSLLATGTISWPQAAAWNTVAISPALQVSQGATYWFALLGTGGNVNFRDEASAVCAESPAAGGLAALPVVWTTGSTWTGCNLSAYVSTATVTPPADVVAPETSISSGPAGSSSSTSASVAFAGSDDVTAAGSLVFECQLDGGSWAGCSSPKSYAGLAVGSHTFSVRARDAAGNVDASPASVTWTITAPPSGTADRYVSPTGSDSNACTAVAPCLTLNRAYKVATAGQTVEVAGGGYAAQTMSADAGKAGPGVVSFRPAAGATVSLASMYMEGTSYVRFTGIDFGRKIQVENTDPSIAGSTSVTFENASAETFRFVGRVSNITVRGGSFGNTVDNQPQIKKYNPGDPAFSRPFNTLIDGASFANFLRSGSAIHTECLQILHADTVIVRNSRFNNCDGTGAIGITDGPSDNITIENNMFGPGGDAYFNAQITKSVRNLLLRFNSSAKAMIFSDTEVGGPYNVTGNYLPRNASFCTSGATYTANVLQGGTCGASDISVAAMRFVDAANLDLHLRSDSEARNAIPLSVAAPATDIDGDARPLGGALDAGADEAG